jgi:hypothetical protein
METIPTSRAHYHRSALAGIDRRIRLSNDRMMKWWHSKQQLLCGLALPSRNRNTAIFTTSPASRRCCLTSHPTSIVTLDAVSNSMVSKWTPFFTLFWAPSFSPFPRPPSPPSWRNEKSRLRSCSLELNLTVRREGPIERKRALEITGSTTIRLRRIKIRC